MNKKTLAYLELTKPGITRLVVITTIFGFFISLGEISHFAILIPTIIGTALTCSGSSTLNNYLERDFDTLMNRTKNRAIPRGAISAAEALGFGLLLVLSGTIILVAYVNLLTGFLALLTSFLYIMVYTPLKRLTWLNTFIGAIPGAIPPMGGWVAASGELELGAWIIFAVMFFWQLPHFYAISWMYKDDYANAGYKMISLNDDGKKTFSQAIFFAICLILTSLSFAVLNNIGMTYLVSASLLGVIVLSYSFAAYCSRTRKAAVGLLRSTIIYLPLLFVVMLVDTLV